MLCHGASGWKQNTGLKGQSALWVEQPSKQGSGSESPLYLMEVQPQDIALLFQKWKSLDIHFAFPLVWTGRVCLLFRLDLSDACEGQRRKPKRKKKGAQWTVRRRQGENAKPGKAGHTMLLGESLCSNVIVFPWHLSQRAKCFLCVFVSGWGVLRWREGGDGRMLLPREIESICDSQLLLGM